MKSFTLTVGRAMLEQALTPLVEGYGDKLSSEPTADGAKAIILTVALRSCYETVDHESDIFCAEARNNGAIKKVSKIASELGLKMKRGEGPRDFIFFATNKKKRMILHLLQDYFDHLYQSMDAHSNLGRI